MDDSQYIFDQVDSIFYIVVIAGVLLLLSAGYQFYRIKIKQEPYFYFRDQDGNETRRLPTAIGLAILGVVLLVFLAPSQRNVYKGIKENPAEASGTTIEKLYEGHLHEVKYKFEVNSQTYYGECGFTYDGHEIEGIKVPNGHYKVIYNKNNPNESVMDFKANIDAAEN